MSPLTVGGAVTCQVSVFALIEVFAFTTWLPPVVRKCNWPAPMCKTQYVANQLQSLFFFFCLAFFLSSKEPRVT